SRPRGLLYRQFDPGRGDGRAAPGGPGVHSTEQMRHKAAMLADSTLAAAPPTLAEARATLERVWGHADFRGRQAEVVAEVLAGRDVLAVLPTGGGKRVWYQGAAVPRPGRGLVVSRLVALMTAEVEALRQGGVRAARLGAGGAVDDRAGVWRAAGAGELDLLYVSAEVGAQPHLIDGLRDLP